MAKGAGALSRLLAYGRLRTSNLLGLPLRSIRSLACDSREIAPEEVGRLPPPVTLEGQIERATGTFVGELSEAIHYATMTECTHWATLAFCVEDVAIARGCLYKDGRAEHVSNLGWPGIRKPREVGERVLASTLSGNEYFADWLLGDTLLELIAGDLAVKPLKTRPRRDYPHQDGITESLGLSRDYADCIRVGRLHIIEDVGYNRYKRKRLRYLRSELRRSLGSRSSGPSPIYLLRGDRYQSGRKLLNEGEIIHFLERRGFAILDPITLPTSQLLHAVLDCPVAIGVEGSQLAHGCLGLRETGLMLTLQPPYRFQPSSRPRCTSVGVRWGFLVGLQRPGGFEIPVDELAAILKDYT
jgi:hypothetical protein